MSARKHEKVKEVVMTLDEYIPAFPTVYHNGMRLRDYFAAKALNGILSNPDDVYGVPIEAFAESAYRYADAMLKARNQGERV